jgi:hypothetical protein
MTVLERSPTNQAVFAGVRTDADRTAAARVNAIDLADAADVDAERPAPKRARLPSGHREVGAPLPTVDAKVKAEPDTVAAAWPALFHCIRRQPFDAAEYTKLIQRYLEPRKIALPDREQQTRRVVTVRSRGAVDGPPAIEQFALLAQAVRRHKAAGEDEAVLYHLRCLAQWQRQYQPRGVAVPAIVSGATEEGDHDVIEAFDLTGEDEEQTAAIDVERWIAECWVERAVKAEPGAAVGGGGGSSPGRCGEGRAGGGGRGCGECGVASSVQLH